MLRYMNKRGFLGFGVFGFFLMLFLLFYFLNSLGFIEITGFASHDGQTNLTVNKILFTKVSVVNNVPAIINESFNLHDSIACIVQHDLVQGGITNLSFVFYSPQNSVENPNKFFADVFNDTAEETRCEEDICFSYYNLTDYIFGDWRCAALWDNRMSISSTLAMNDSAPEFLEDIDDIILNKDGSYKNQSKLDLDKYFLDLEGDDLEYGAVGQMHLVLNIKSNGEVQFLNPENFEGTETIKFRAHDGLKGTFSNDVVVTVGSGITSVLGAQCNFVWDCNWGECINGKQTCIYFDRNNCGSIQGKPADLERDCAGALATAGGKKPLVLTGDLDIEKPAVTGIKRTLMIVGIVVIVLALVGFGVYLLYRKPVARDVTKHPYVQQPVQQNLQTTQTVNFTELQNYIESALQEGQGRQNIEIDLLKVGWQKSDIESSYNIVILKKFVKDKLSNGVSKEDILKGLKLKGWSDDLINAVFGALGK